ncbi:SH3 domain-containing protein [Exiguobacterium sp. A1_3_1]|uniref:SH3 domain-containing protein n=1 Tax=Exiguobacterium sp. A1_3_1 TaxID=2651871 RepID=UPI003B89D1ED
MKSIKFLIAVMLIGTVLSYNVKMASAASKTETLYVVADQLNVREKDSTKSKKVGSLKIGSKVKVYSQAKNGWSEIDFKKKKAYVYSKYIKKAPKNQFSRIKFFAKQGQLETTLPLVVGDKAFTAIDYLGKPYFTENNRSLELHFKNSVNYSRLVIQDHSFRGMLTYKKMTKNSYVESQEQMFSKKQKIIYNDVKKVLGNADSKERFEGMNDYLISYDLGKYQLVFHTHLLSSDSPAKKVENTQILGYSVIETFIPNN